VVWGAERLSGRLHVASFKEMSEYKNPLGKLAGAAALPAQFSHTNQRVLPSREAGPYRFS
jgi:hypothetical protein